MTTRVYERDPGQIEAESFRIIQEEINQIDKDYQFETPVHEAVIKRAIHTTADFEYLYNLEFNHDPLKKIQDVVSQGGTIITDTNMALSGINKKVLNQYGCQYHCFVGEPKVAKLAQLKGTTRSMAAIDVAAEIKGPKCFVIGNAPTALYKILELREAGSLDVDVVVGVPVGFVGAAESKLELSKSDCPSIVAKGRKGGSNLAAAIINAVLYNMPGSD